MSIECRLLGDVEVRLDGQLVEMGHLRQRCVLAVLLVEANRVVPVDQLVDRVWGTRRLPARPAGAVQTYVSLLRRALAVIDEVAIHRRPGGYLLAVDEDVVDLHRFRRLVDRARGSDDGVAVALFEQAMALWRGEPFALLDTPWLNTVRSTLDQYRQAARLDLTDILLRQGRLATLPAELADQAARHPLDERLAGQLMVALYRSGRPTDALEHYHRLRKRLAEQLGSDPGPPLRELYRRMLAADPALAAPGAAPLPPSTRSVVPRQLPAAPRPFTGRADELARLGTLLDGAPPHGGVSIAAVGGIGGIGKTWLALHWAHRHLDRFPDGQLYVDLRGFDPSGRPVPSSVAVRGFLDALGVGPASIPPDPDAQVGLYRSLVAGRRLLIVLDNAADTAQVVPLLPGGPAGAVLVTSRRHLGGLVTAHGAHPVDLDVLTTAEGHDLLVNRLGADRSATEPRAITELVAYCAGLPLALSIVAARAAGRPDFPLAALADELRDRTGRLDALDAGDTGADLRAVLSWSQRALPAAAATLFGLLGLAPGPDIGVLAAASLAGITEARARALLRDLDHAHLVDHHAPGRHRMHDLVRLHAADHGRRAEPGTDRTSALRRLVDHYLHTAYAADRLLDVNRPPLRLDDPVPGCHVHHPADDAAALAWFTAEHANLLAAQELAADHGWHTPVWQLAWSLNVFHYLRGHIHEGVLTCEAGVVAADQLGDPVIQALAHRRLGNALTLAGRHPAAQRHLGQALTLAEQAGDLHSQAQTHRALASSWVQCADHRQALAHAVRARRLFRLVRTPAGECYALIAMGYCHLRLGGQDRALRYSEAALALARDHGDVYGEAAAVDTLGDLAHRAGRHDQAGDYYQRALALRRELGDTYEEPHILDRLAQTHQALGHHDSARTAWHQALRIYQSQHRAADIDRILGQLASCEA